MSDNKQKVVDKEKRTDTIVGIVTVTVILALIAWLFVSVSLRARAIGAIAYDGEVRRGQEQTFTADVMTNKIKDGDSVRWIVDGHTVAESTYVQGEPLTLNYTPKTSGTSYVTVQVGGYNQTTHVDVLPAQLTVTAPNVVITYGEDIPNLTCQYSGLTEEDCDNCLNYENVCYLCDDNGERLQSDKLNVGVYQLNAEQTCEYDGYDVNYVGGTLTVLPKSLTVANKITKTYDGLNTVENPDIVLAGVIKGDEVKATCDKLYFDNKNAGENKQIMLANVTLDGKDSCNYVLEGYACGNIAPKQVQLSGLVVRDKTYDGTTRAQVERIGTLDGVVNGDSVAIGSLSLSFAEAEAGTQQIVLDNVTLIGADKNNYEVTGADADSANITTTIWNKIFVKNPAIAAESN